MCLSAMFQASSHNSGLGAVPRGLVRESDPCRSSRGSPTWAGARVQPLQIFSWESHVGWYTSPTPTDLPVSLLQTTSSQSFCLSVSTVALLMGVPQDPFRTYMYGGFTVAFPKQ